MSGRDDVDVGYDLAGALVATDNIIREAFANLKAMVKEEDGRGMPRDLVPVYIQSATLIYVADRIATALEALDGVAIATGRLADAAENIDAETGFVAEALEKLAEGGRHTEDRRAATIAALTGNVKMSGFDDRFDLQSGVAE